MGRVQTQTRPGPDPIKRVWKGLLWIHTRLSVYPYTRLLNGMGLILLEPDPITHLPISKYKDK